MLSSASGITPTPPSLFLLVGFLDLSVCRVRFQSQRGARHWGTVPPWQASSDNPAPSIVIGELHYPTAAQEGARNSLRPSGGTARGRGSNRSNRSDTLVKAKYRLQESTRLWNKR